MILRTIDGKIIPKVDLNHHHHTVDASSHAISNSITNILTKAITMETTTIYAHSPDSTRNIFSSHSSLTALHHPDVKCFDVEADMAEAVIPQDPNARPKHFSSAFEECVFIFTVMMSAASTTFLQGVTVINTASIGRDLNMTAAEVTWISAALGYEKRSPSSL